MPQKICRFKKTFAELRLFSAIQRFFSYRNKKHQKFFCTKIILLTKISAFLYITCSKKSAVSKNNFRHENLCPSHGAKDGTISNSDFCTKILSKKICHPQPDSQTAGDGYHFKTIIIFCAVISKSTSYIIFMEISFRDFYHIE